MAWEVMRGIYRLGVPLPHNPLKELNAYLIKGKDRNLLIDTGFRQKACLEALREELERLSVHMEETDILLTHLHSDHTGLVADIASGTTRVFIDAQDKNWLTRDTRFALEVQEDDQYRAAGFAEDVLAHISRTHPGRSLAPDPDFDRYETVSEGNVIEVGDYALELIRVPGHTPGQMCLWMKEQKAMFTADHVLFDITPNITKWPDCEDSLGKYIESLHKIDSYPVKTALPGHQMSGDFHARIGELLVHHTERLAECERIVQETPGMTAYDIAGRMSWNIYARNWETFPVRQKWFAVGECLAHLDRLQCENKVTARRQNGMDRYEPC